MVSAPGRSLLALTLVARVAAQLRMMAPTSLVNQFSASHGRIEGSTATFGAPFYGERVVGQLVWGDSRTGHLHCKEDDYEIPPPPQPSGHERGQMPPLNIVIVRRGLCTFVTKVRVAQKKGAHAVIIVDREDSTMSPGDIRRIIVADDGYGDTVTIPSMLVSNQEGQRLIDAAKAGEEVIAELAWDVPTDEVVIVDQWLSSGSRESFRFLKDFAEKRKALNDVVKFVPHYYVFGMKSSVDSYNELCTSTRGDFCTEDPDGAGPVTGAMVLDEDVRQLCIHELYSVAQTRAPGSSKQVEYAREYWDYVARFMDECPIEGKRIGYRFGTACAERVMQNVGINVGQVSSCMQRTQDAKLLEQRENVAWSPRALRINGWRYNGMMDADLVTRAICAGFTTQPEACARLMQPHPVLQQITRTINEGMSVATFVLSLVSVVVLGLAVFCFYRRSLRLQLQRSVKEEVMLEVQSQLGAYSKMSA